MPAGAPVLSGVHSPHRGAGVLTKALRDGRRGEILRGEGGAAACREGQIAVASASITSINLCRTGAADRGEDAGEAHAIHSPERLRFLPSGRSGRNRRFGQGAIAAIPVWSAIAPATDRLWHDGVSAGRCGARTPLLGAHGNDFLRLVRGLTALSGQRIVYNKGQFLTKILLFLGWAKGKSGGAHGRR